MSVEKIKNIESLILLDKNQEIVDHKVKPLTAPGENYGSLMLSLDVTVKTPKDNEVLNLVAKMVPPNEFIQEIFNTQVTFRNEIGFYKDIVPTLQQFQKEHGVENVIDFSPKYLGSRVNLNDDPKCKVDSDAALILENLKVKNFVTMERTEGFNLEIAKMILTDLAYFHAVPLALKIQKPEVFEKVIKPHLHLWDVKEKSFNDMKMGFDRMLDKLSELQELKARSKTGFATLIKESSPREPFATISHNDVWVNNTMLKLEEGKPIKSKLVDYQVCSYGSPARDILFFLFSSVKTEVLRESFDDLIQFYYDKFQSVLAELKCDVSQFSFEDLQKELDHEAKYSQFGHIMFMLFPIFLPKEEVQDVSDLNQESMTKEVEPSELHKEKFIYIVQEFAKRNWI